MLVVFTISCCVYFLIAFTMIITDKHKIPVNSKQSISFSATTEYSFRLNTSIAPRMMYTKNGEYVLLEGIDHIGVTMDTDAMEVISSWINKFSN